MAVPLRAVDIGRVNSFPAADVRACAPRRVSQRGQSITEFLVLLVMLLLPLLLLLRLQGGILFQQQEMEVAARYAAWERTVWNAAAPPGPGGGDTVKADEDIALEIDRRVLAEDGRQVVSGDLLDYELDPFLRQVSAGRSDILKLREDSPATPRHARTTTASFEPGGMVGVMDNALGHLGAVTRFDLPRGGLYETTVATDLIDLRAPVGLPLEILRALSIRRSNTIFGEAWTAGGTRQAQHLVSGLLPQQFLDNGVVRNFQSFASVAPVSRELGWLDLGHVDIDALPPYRLGPEAPRP